MCPIHLISILLLGSPGAADQKADVTALQRPISVLSPPVSAIKGDPRATATVPPTIANNWQSIQAPLARGLMPARIAPGSPLRFDPPRIEGFSQGWTCPRFGHEAREYIFFLYGGTSALADQVEADRLALESARDKRNRALIDASNALSAALREPGADRKALMREYNQSWLRIRAEYEQVRERILGTNPQAAAMTR